MFTLLRNNSWNREYNRSFLLSIIVQWLCVYLIIRFIGTHGWDDGAITLAFSKTFTQTGRIALTPVSESVEGFSSISWFLVNSISALFHPNFAGAIMLAQSETALCITLSLYFLMRLCKNLGASPLATDITLITFALSGASISETANGMEMGLLAASSLAFTHYIYFERRAIPAAIAAAFFISTRFEAMFYYAFLCIPLLLQQRYKATAFWLGLGAMIFLSLGVWRYIEFADVLPNTVYAKLHPPYLHSESLYKLKGSLEIPAVLAPLIFITLGLMLAALKNKKIDRSVFPARKAVILLIMPIIGAEIFASFTGKIWGYTGRMEFFAIPYALLLCSYAYSRVIGFFSNTIRTVSVAIALSTIPLSWLISAPLPLDVLMTSLSPTHSVNANPFRIAPATYRDTGLAVEQLRQQLHLKTIVFLTPDVGGAGLCCARLDIIDLAMLTNRILAKNGYLAFPYVFSKEKPDVIEAHGAWAEYSGIYNDPEFNHYRPILINNTRLFLRDDHYQALIQGKIGTICPFTNKACAEKIMKSHRYAATVTGKDTGQYLKYGSFLELGNQ